MSSEYKQGVDKVSMDESFPYPIKLTYDDENVYLKVVRYPKNKELVANPYMLSGIRRGRCDPEGYPPYLTLCLEYKCTDYFDKCRDVRRRTGKKNNPLRRFFALCGGSPGNQSFVITRNNEGDVYTISKLSTNTKIVYKISQYDDCWCVMRGAFRYGKGFLNDRGGYRPGRTGLVSNVVKVPISMSEE